MSQSGTTLRLSDREVLLEQHVVMRGDQVVAELTPLEAQFLAYLAARPGEVVAREVLLREVWGYAPTVHSRAIDKTVHRLRTKLEPEPAEPRHLVGVRSMGYRLADLGFTVESVAGEEPHADGHTLGPALSEAEAVRALTTRALALGADPEAIAADARSLSTIAHRLDLLPAALEIAARRLVVVSPGELARALQATDDPGEVLPALAPLAAATWAALPPELRGRLAWLVAFRGPFTRAQARALPAVGEALPELLPAALASGGLLAEGHGLLRLGALVVGPARRALGENAEEAERQALEVLSTEAVGLAVLWRAGDGHEPVRALERLLPSLRRLMGAHATTSPATVARALTATGPLLLRASYQWFGELVEVVLPRLAPDDPQLAWMLMWRARAAHSNGQIAIIADLARAAIAAARGDPVVIGEATVTLSAGLYWGCEDGFDFAPDVEAALLALRDRREPNLEARLHLSVGLWYERAGQWDRAVLQHRHAATTLWQTGEVALLANALGFCVSPLAASGRLEEARIAADLAIVAHREAGAELQLLHAVRMSGSLHHFVGELDAARAMMLEVLDRGRERGDAVAEFYARDTLAAVALERGLLHEARAHIAASQERCAAIGAAPTRARLDCLHAILQIETDELEAARIGLRGVLESCNNVVRREVRPTAVALQALLCATTGDAEGLNALEPVRTLAVGGPDRYIPGLLVALRPVPAALTTPPGSPERARVAAELRAFADGLPGNMGSPSRHLARLTRRLATQLQA